MTDVTLTRALAVALVDRLDAAFYHSRQTGFASASVAVRDALHRQSGTVEVTRPAQEVEVTFTEDEVTYALRAALVFGSGRPVA